MALYAGAIFDLGLGILTFAARGRLRRATLEVQLLLVPTYTIFIMLHIPDRWLHSFGALTNHLRMLVGIGLLPDPEAFLRGRWRMA